MAEHINKLKNGMVLISTEVPAGLYNSLQLKAISTLCEGEIAMAKATEDQRIALFVKEEQVDHVTAELKKVGLGFRFYGEGLHSPVVCLGELGTDAEQNSLADTMAVTEALSTIDWQNRPPFKIGINSSASCCVASHTLDISMIAGPDGYQMSIGGKNSQIPEFGSLVAEGIPGEKLTELVLKVVTYYLKNSELEETLHDMIMRTGISGFVDLLAPYSQDAPDLADPFSQTDVPAPTPLSEDAGEAGGLAAMAATTLEQAGEQAEAEEQAGADAEALATSADEQAANDEMAAVLDDEEAVATSVEEAEADAAMAAAVEEAPAADQTPAAEETPVADQTPVADEELAADAEQLAEAGLEDIDLSGLDDEPAAEPAEASAEEGGDDDLALAEVLAEEPAAEDAVAEKEPSAEEASTEEAVAAEEELDLSALEEEPSAEEASAEEAVAAKEPAAEEELDLSALEEEPIASEEAIAEEASAEEAVAAEEPAAEEELDLSALEEEPIAAEEAIPEESIAEEAIAEEAIAEEEPSAEEAVAPEAEALEAEALEAEAPEAEAIVDEQVAAPEQEDASEADLESSIEQSIDEEKTFLDQEEDDPNEQAREQIAAGAIEIPEEPDNVVALRPSSGEAGDKLLTKICMPDATTVCIEFGDELKVELDMIELKDRESPVTLQGKQIAFDHRPGEIMLSVDGFTVVIAKDAAA